MKVAVLGPYKSGTGYDKACMETILSLDAVGITVVPRHVPMTNNSGSIDNRILELEKNDLNNVDVVFNYNLPSEFCYKGGVLNVGGFAYETDGFPNTNWNHHLSLMDHIVVPCSSQKETVIKALGRQTWDPKVSVVGHSVDCDKFQKEYPKFDFGLPKNTIKFYTIAEFGRRKNIAALLAAYFSQFSSDDNVVLVIKTHVPNRNPMQTSEYVHKIINDLKEGMHRFSSPERYPKVILFSNYMSDDELNGLHQSCDVFVTASHGEAWCLPAIDAMGFGNFVIAPKHGAFKDYVKECCGTLVDGVESPVFGVNEAPDGLYSADERWFNVNIHDLALAMQDVYLNNYMYKSAKLSTDMRTYVMHTFSRTTIGSQLKDVLNAAAK